LREALKSTLRKNVAGERERLKYIVERIETSGGLKALQLLLSIARPQEYRVAARCQQRKVQLQNSRIGLLNQHLARLKLCSAGWIGLALGVTLLRCDFWET
jgi:hypothetical protein